MTAGIIGMATVLVGTVLSTPDTRASTAQRTRGPAGSLVLVETAPATPLVWLSITARSGAAADPRGAEGLTNFAAELARRGAGERDRVALDAAFDALGAELNVRVDADATHLTGHVLASRLDEFLALAADVVLRPRFAADELKRTRRELIAEIEEDRTDDTALCARYFARRLYGEHPYGRAPDGTRASLTRLKLAQLSQRFRSVYSGKNVIFAAVGAVEPPVFTAAVNRAFAGLAEGGARPAPPASPRAPHGWRIQVVDKPERNQVQIMFGQAGVPAAHPDYLPLTVALAAFGGHGMTSTLMSEVRSQRGLAYGAYMDLGARRGPAPITGWASTGADRAVQTLKLLLRLYGQLHKKGLDETQVAFFREFLAGSWASEVDPPGQRLRMRVAAEVLGLPEDWVDTYPDRLRAVTAADVNRAITTHLHPNDLAITLVATATPTVARLTRAKVDPGAIDVVPYDAY